MQLIARAPDTGRSSSHRCSPRTARVAKAESSRGGGKRTGLSASHAATTAPCLALRFQTGNRTSGVDAHRVHTLQGCECREKTHRVKCDPVDVMATGFSRRRPTRCWSKIAEAKEPRARRSTEPHAAPHDGLGAHDEGRDVPDWAGMAKRGSPRGAAEERELSSSGDGRTLAGATVAAMTRSTPPDDSVSRNRRTTSGSHPGWLGPERRLPGCGQCSSRPERTIRMTSSRAHTHEQTVQSPTADVVASDSMILTVRAGNGALHLWQVTGWSASSGTGAPSAIDEHCRPDFPAHLIGTVPQRSVGRPANPSGTTCGR